MSDNGLFSRLIHGLSFEKTLGTASWMTVAVANKFDCVQVYHWRTCHLRAHWIGRYGPMARMSTNQGPSTVLFWWTIENTGTSEQGLKLRTYPGLSCKIKKVSTFPGPGGQQLKIRTFPGNKDPWEPCKHIECGHFLRDHAGFHEHNEPRVVLDKLWHDIINSHTVTKHACTFSCLPLATQYTKYTITLQ